MVLSKERRFSDYINTKVEYRAKNITRTELFHSKIELFNSMNIIITKFYAPNNRTQFMKQNQLELQGQINKSTNYHQRFQYPSLRN